MTISFNRLIFTFVLVIISLFSYWFIPKQISVSDLEHTTQENKESQRQAKITPIKKLQTIYSDLPSNIQNDETKLASNLAQLLDAFRLKKPLGYL